jgi:hypothetical protein
MAKPSGLKVTYDDVSQTIDFSEVAGVDLTGNQILIREMSQAVIDFIVERAQSGKGIGGKTLKKPYSKAYSESLDFKAAGKSKNDVNMTLSGDMLGAIDVLEEDGPTVKIGFADTTDNVKAYGHMSGFEGHPYISGPKREFFGVTKAELKEKILSQFKDDIQEIKRTNRTDNEQDVETQSALIRTARRITDFINFDGES